MKSILLPLLVALVTLTRAAIPGSVSAGNGWDDGDDDSMILDSSTSEAPPNSEEIRTALPPKLTSDLTKEDEVGNISDGTKTLEFTRENSSAESEKVEEIPSSDSNEKESSEKPDAVAIEDLPQTPLTYMVPPRQEEESVWSKYPNRGYEDEEGEQMQDTAAIATDFHFQTISSSSPPPAQSESWERDLKEKLERYLDKVANEVVIAPKQWLPERAALEPESYYPIPEEMDQIMQNSQEYSPSDEAMMMTMTPPPPPPRMMMAPPPPTPEEDSPLRRKFYNEREVDPSIYNPFFGERYASNYLDSDYFYYPPSPSRQSSFYYNPNQFYQIQEGQFSEDQVGNGYRRYNNFPSSASLVDELGYNRNPYFNTDQSQSSSSIFQMPNQKQSPYSVDPNRVTTNYNQNGPPSRPVHWMSGSGYNYNNEGLMQVPRYQNSEYDDWPMMYAPSYPYPNNNQRPRQLPFRFHNYY